MFYSNSEELWRVLADYFHTGLEQGELGILVTHFSPKEIAQGFSKLGFDIKQPLMKGDLRIFNMIDTYLPDGRFVADFMMGNVLNFIEDAKQLGYSGLRTAGEMGWLDDHPQYHGEAIYYEDSVNGLVSENPSFTGICLYSTKDDLSPSMEMKSVLNAHPSYFYNGELIKNPKSA